MGGWWVSCLFGLLTDLAGWAGLALIRVCHSTIQTPPFEQQQQQQGDDDDEAGPPLALGPAHEEEWEAEAEAMGPFAFAPFMRGRPLGDGAGVGAALAGLGPATHTHRHLRVLELRSCRLAGPLLGHICAGLKGGAWPVLEELRLPLGDMGAEEMAVLCVEGLARMGGNRGAGLRVLELSGNDVRRRWRGWRGWWVWG